MKNVFKKKAIAILLCGLAGTAIAAGNANNNMSNTTTAPAMNSNTTGTTTNANSDMSAGMQANDSKLTSDVNSALNEYTGKVNVVVKEGVVYLSGQLPSDTDYEKVVTYAESVKGTSDVNVDKLTVKDSSAPMHDTYITAKVKGALIQADLMGKDIPSWTVSVETKDGQVFLSGTIASENERKAVVETVKKVKGVTKVNDKLTVGTKDTTAKPVGTPAASDQSTTGNDSDDDDSTSDDDEDDSDDEDAGSTNSPGSSSSSY